ncbi:MAG: hypothetical protein K2I72_02765, partial [Bacilli bacterium]|nr:hypothetical protein [Bacilli bacterium]
YSIEDSDQLELLRFNLKIKKWYRLCQELGEGYVKRRIPPKEIEYAVVSKANPKEIKLKWKQLENYPLIELF